MKTPPRTVRFILWKRQGGLCHWCKRPTLLPPGDAQRKKSAIPANEATLDHVYSRLDPRRDNANLSQRLVMSCHKCNQRRGADEHASYPRYKHQLRSLRSLIRKSHAAIDTA